MEIPRYGWVRDLPDHRDLLYSAVAHAPARLPDAVDLRSGFTPCYNQGDLGSCTANAIAGALQYLEGKEGAQAPEMPSRLFIYYNERELEGSVEFDSGAQIRDGVKTLVKIGYCSEDEWPYDVDRFSERPPEACYRDARRERLSQYLRLDRELEQLLGCLASGYPFVFGFTVFESFELPEVARTGIARMPGVDEHVVGGHAVVAAGYDRAADRFLVRNSWGAEWGMGGYFTMPFEYLLSPGLAADFWTLRHVPVPA